MVNQGSGGVLGAAEAGDRFGYSIAVGDVDCDEFTDLVVGSPYEDVGTAVDSGYMQIVWGAVGGLGSGSPSRQFTQTSFGETVHAGDQFGYAVDLLEDVGQGEPPSPMRSRWASAPRVSTWAGTTTPVGWASWRQWTAAT